MSISAFGVTPPVDASSAAAQTSTPLPAEEIERLTNDIVAALKTVYDPEIPADIYELGLIYRVDIEDDRSVKVDMTLTTPNCPSAQELPMMVENAVSSVPLEFRTRSMRPSSSSSTCPAVVGLMRPNRFADGAATVLHQVWAGSGRFQDRAIGGEVALQAHYASGRR